MSSYSNIGRFTLGNFVQVRDGDSSLFGEGFQGTLVALVGTNAFVAKVNLHLAHVERVSCQSCLFRFELVQ
jgi:hypothetical protein